MNTLQENVSEKQKEVERLRECIQAHNEESAAKLKLLEEQLHTKEDQIIKLNQRDLEKDKEMDTQLQNINGKHRREIEKLENIIRANTEEAAAQLKHLEEEFNGKTEAYKRKNMMMEDEMENINKQHEETERHSDELRQQTKEERERNNVLQNMNAGLGMN